MIALAAERRTAADSLGNSRPPIDAGGPTPTSPNIAALVVSDPFFCRQFRGDHHSTIRR